MTAKVRCGAGAATGRQLDAALAEALRDAAAQLGAEPREADLAVAFVSGAYGTEVRPALEGLADLIGARTVLGASAEAVLCNGREHEEGPAVAVWLARMPGATLVPVSIEHARTPDGGMFVGWPPGAGAGAAVPWPENAALLLLADPFSFPADAFLKRVAEDHPGLPIIGGMASGGLRPGGNTLAIGARTYDSGAVGVLVGGGARIRPVVSQGCRPIGATYVITRAESNLIIELGGRPALERLREVFATLGPADRELVKSSLFIGRAATEYQDRFGPGDFLVRSVAGADPDSGVLAVGDLVRTGQTVQFHVRDAASAHDDLHSLLADARAAGAAPAGALVFTCNGRGTRLFPEPDHDARCLADALGPLPAAGFFAQGEFGPIGRLNCLHGFTASIALVEPA
ncbi:MAG: FIST N-terminal domain-containing protein [Planctomycetaceae bacterium]